MLDLAAVARQLLERAGVGAGRVQRALHELQRRALLLPPARRRANRAPGRSRMAELITGHRLDPERVRARTSSEVREAGGPELEILAATKYVPRRRDGGAGRGRGGAGRREPPSGPGGQAGALGRPFTWDFIGNLQSRKVKRILPLVRLIHSVATDSALEQLGRHGDAGTEVLVEVNLSGRGEQGRGRARRSSARSSSAAPSGSRG